MTDQEYILYLKVIQDKCTDRYYCDGCKYYTSFGCAFKNIPADWNLDKLPAYQEALKEGSGNNGNTNSK